MLLWLNILVWGFIFVTHWVHRASSHGPAPAPFAKNLQLITSAARETALGLRHLHAMFWVDVAARSVEQIFISSLTQATWHRGWVSLNQTWHPPISSISIHLIGHCDSNMTCIDMYWYVLICQCAKFHFLPPLIIAFRSRGQSWDRVSVPQIPAASRMAKIHMSMLSKEKRQKNDEVIFLTFWCGFFNLRTAS